MCGGAPLRYVRSSAALDAIVSGRTQRQAIKMPFTDIDQWATPQRDNKPRTNTAVIQFPPLVCKSLSVILLRSRLLCLAAALVKRWRLSLQTHQTATTGTSGMPHKPWRFTEAEIVSLQY